MLEMYQDIDQDITLRRERNAAAASIYCSNRDSSWQSTQDFQPRTCLMRSIFLKGPRVKHVKHPPPNELNTPPQRGTCRKFTKICLVQVSEHGTSVPRDCIDFISVVFASSYLFSHELHHQVHSESVKRMP